MGFEYKIKFNIKDEEELKTFVEQVLNFAPQNEVSISLDKDGFYFCDNLISNQISSVVFRKLVDKAISVSNEVLIYEP